LRDRRENTVAALAGADTRLPFEGLYERYFAFVWRALRHLGVPGPSLEDCAQEVWMVVHRRLGEFEWRSSVRTWLFGIALNVVRNRRRGVRRAPEMIELPEHVSSGKPDAAGLHEGQEAWRKIERYLDTLDEQRRSVFVCSLLEQLPAAETAEATGLDVATVYHLVRRLRQGFRAFLDELEGAQR
jgi:RNA polymerase sigma-70 factor, ECF subfamily